ncbi:MAG: PIN domain-containing protein [Dehalococcoidia bacterium]|nr:PIN domain-containing protein [Dehalococcoidia bacterium]
MKAGEMAFLDTNVLVYASETDNPLHQAATSFMDKVIAGEILSCVSPQVMGELFSTITNPRKIKNPCQLDEAVRIVETLWEMETIRRIYPRKGTLSLTLNLARRYQLKGLIFFDAQIVATMLDNGVTTIYTANEKDFIQFREIAVVNPFSERSNE